MKKIIFSTLLILCTGSSIFAQSGGFAGASQRIGYDPISMSMGNAMTATTSLGSYAFYNPALAAIKLDYIQTNLSVSSLEYDRIHQTAGVAFQLPPSAGISINITRTGINDIDGRSLSGYPDGEFDASEYQFHTAFAIRMSNKVSAGVGFKINYANYHNDLDPATSVGLDLGILYKINTHFNFAFAIQDLLAEYRWNSDDLYGQSQSRTLVNKFPTRFKWALAYQKENFTISTEYEIQALTSEVNEEEIFISGGRPTLISSITELKTNAQQFRLGGSWNAHERVTLRAGYQLPDMSDSESWGAGAGFSVHLPFDKFAPAVNYAFVMEPNRVSNMHVFSLILQL